MKIIKAKISTEVRNPKIFNIDHFWDDCIKEEQKQNDPLFILNQDKNNNLNNSNRSYINNYYKKLCHKIPNLYQEEQNSIIKKKKIKKSLKHSLLLYSYGLEQKRVTQSNFIKNKLHKEKEELKLCTWKPTLYKPNQTKLNNNVAQNTKRNRNEVYNSNKLIEMANKKECTFKPSINVNKGNDNIKKIFNRSKSVVLYTDKENFSFMLRYKKARDEYMIKRFKKLSVKDESYRNSFLEMTSRDCEKNYKNYLNVNNNIEVYDLDLKSNYNDNKYIFNLSAGNNSNSFSKRKINKGDKTQTHKTKKYYMGILKKQLSLINLEAY